MTTYWVGDLQGCNATLGHLLEVLDFSPSRDRLVVLGDLVNRGPDSLGVMHRLMGLGSSATCLLGNHDLFALAGKLCGSIRDLRFQLFHFLLVADAGCLLLLLQQ